MNAIPRLFSTVRLLPALAVIGLCGSPPTLAQDNAQGKVLFILDGSGSMRAKIDKREKIAIAKEVMSNLIKDLPDGVQAGLEVYGHRSKGDCKDIELLTPIGQGDKQSLIANIQAIQPKGKTPITQALELAAEQLKGSEEETTVVLISDGKETCEGDPCARVKALKDEGINVRIHVVGFDVNKEEKDQLYCIADAGGGKYFSADNAAQLKDALTEVKKAVVEKIEVKKPEPPPKVEAKKPEPTGLKLSAVLAEGSQPIAKDIVWKILDPKADLEGNHKQIAYEIGPSHVFTLPSGHYLVSAKFGDAEASQEIEVNAEQAQTQIVNFNAGQIKLSGVLAAGGPPVDKDIVWKILSAKADLEGNRKQAAYEIGPSYVFALPAGHYLATAKFGDAYAEKEIEIKPGDGFAEVVNLNAGQVKLSAVLAEGGQPLTKDIVWKILAGKADLEGNRKQAAYEISPNRVFSLNAGHYLVTAKFGDAYAEKEIEIKPGDGFAEVVNLNAGQVKLSAVLGASGAAATKDVQWKIYKSKTEQEDKGERVAYEIEPSHVFTLNAGDYLVEAEVGEAKAQAEFSLTAGEQKEIQVKIP